MGDQKLLDFQRAHEGKIEWADDGLSVRMVWYHQKLGRCATPYFKGWRAAIECAVELAA